jgi:hypothetical protein
MTAVGAPLALLPAAACAGADPGLFFPEPGDTVTEAVASAICAGCPARAECYATAARNGERAGIWGGVNFETQAEAWVVHANRNHPKGT